MMDQGIVFECKEYDWGWSIWIKSRGKFHFKKQIASKLKSEEEVQEFIRSIGVSSKIELVKKKVKETTKKNAERSKKDSVYFAEEYLGIKLEDWQKNLLKKYDEGAIIFDNGDASNTVLKVIRKQKLHKGESD